MSLLEAISTLYSSAGNTWLSQQVQFYIDKFSQDVFKWEWNQVVSENKEISAQRELIEATDILDMLFDDYSIFIPHILDARENNDYSTLSPEEKTASWDFNKAIVLLESSANKWNQYARCVLTLILDNVRSELVKSIPEKSILDQENMNWYWLKEQPEGSTLWVIQSASEAWNHHAQYNYWKYLIQNWKVSEGLIELKKSYFQWNMNAAFSLASHYYKMQDTSYATYLLPAYKALHSWAIHLQAIILWRNWEKDKALSLLEIQSSIGHRKSMFDYISLIWDAEKRDDFLLKNFSERLESDDLYDTSIKDKYTDIVSNTKIKLSDESKYTRTIYQKFLKQIIDRLRDLFPNINLPSSQEICEVIYFQRRLIPELKTTSIWSYNRGSKDIWIDLFLHIEWCINQLWEIKHTILHVLAHEVIHKVSIENDTNFSLPRFINEWITSSLEELVTDSYSLSYPQERRIFEKLVEISWISKQKMFENFLDGKSWYVKNILDKHIHQLIEHFSKEEDFWDIVSEMKSYET